jgi:hypothetical protein
MLSPGLLRLEGECVSCLCPHDTPLLGLGGQPVFQTLLGLLFLDSARHLFPRFLVLQLGKFELAMGDLLQLCVASLIAYQLLSCFLLHLRENNNAISSVADPGCLSRIPDPEFYPSRIQKHQ